MRIAIFAVLLGLLVPLSPLSAQTTMPGPRLIVPGDNGKQRTLALSRAQIAVQIAGPLARTTFTLTFKNDTDRVLQGDLDFPLPDGASVTGYGLDIDGAMVEGVPVERKQARVAFEKEVRKGADPGLVEQTVGNNFRTRIYPIPAHGTRTIKVQYVADIQVSKSDLVCHVPLHWGQVIPEAVVTVEAEQVGTFPKLQFGEIGRLLTFAPVGDGFLAKHTFTNARFNTDLYVRLPDAAVHSLVLVEPFTRPTLGTAEHYFVVSNAPPLPLQVAMPRPAVRRIGLVWDASLSRRDADLAREQTILRDLLRTLGTVTVDVTILRNEAEPVRTFQIVNGDSAALLTFLKNTVCDGGTQLGTAPFPTNATNGARYDFHLLFTDGLGNLGREMPFPSVVPVYAINGSRRANHALLRHVAERSGGVYLNLTNISDTQAVAAIGTAPFSLLSVTVEQGQVADIFPQGQQPVQGRALITGRMVSEKAVLRLDYGTAGKVGYSEHITLRHGNGQGVGMAGTFWAERKADDLALLPEANREWLLSLGKDFNIVTPNTSLLVLERLDQYIEYGIAPPQSRTAMYTAYKAQENTGLQMKRRFAQDKLTRVLAMWQERVAWWEQKFPTSPKQEKGQPPMIMERDMTVYAAPFTEGDAPTASAPRPRTIATPRPMGERRTITAGGVAQAHASYAAPMASAGSGRGTVAGTVFCILSGRSAAATDKEEAFDEVEASESPTLAAKKTVATITVKAWSPDTPYLTAMKAATTNAYAVYLKQRETYAESPAFYLDCAEYLRQQGQNDLALRVLTNILELKLDDAALSRIVAHRLSQVGKYDLSVKLFEQVAKMRPEEPQSFRDVALVLADRADSKATTSPKAALADYNRALEMLNKVVMGNWDRFAEIESIALVEANRIIVHAKRLPPVAGETLVVPLDARLIRNLDCDLRIVMTWDSDSTDMDLWIDDPLKERCIYNHPRTTVGGRLSRDFTDGYGPEEFVLHSAPKGKYQIRTNYYGERQQRLTGGTTVQATVYTNYGRPDEKRDTLTLRLTTHKETVDIGAATVN